MTEMNLTQAEADALIAMEKVRVNDEQWPYPVLGGGAISVPLVSANKRESFVLDVTRSRIDFSKGTYQNRARQAVILVRLDFGGRAHRNPDDQEIASPHLHVYRESYGDKWAMPIPLDRFPHIDDPWETLHDFMRYCNIVKPPFIIRGLWT